MPRPGVTPVSMASLAQGNGVAGPRGVPSGRAGNAPRKPQDVVPTDVSLRPGSTFGAQRKPADVPQWRAPGGPKAASKMDWRKAAMSNVSAARSQATPNPDTNQLTNQFAAMNVNGSAVPDTNVYNPSMGPSPSMMTTATINVKSICSRASRFTPGKSIHNAFCKLTGRTRDDFRVGQIIYVTYHTPNSNPAVDPNDKLLTKTFYGHVYSKRRMFIVLWKHHQDMFCVPLYTHNGNGLNGKSMAIRDEYMAVVNEADGKVVNETNFPPLRATLKKPLLEKTAVRVTGGIKVACNEDISIVGRITENSYDALMERWQEMKTEASTESVW